MRGEPPHRDDHRPQVTGAGLIDALIRRGSTFAAFRAPGGKAMLYVQDTAELQHPRHGQRCFVLSPFDAADDGPRCIRPDHIVELDERGGQLPAHSASQAPVPRPRQRGLDRAGYHSAVEQAVAAIRAGRLEKVVLARTIEAPLAGITPGALLQAAMDALPQAFIALTRTDPYGLWLGASPERLLTMHDEGIEVDALAGTMTADDAPDDPAAWGEKEREEQELVTRMILDTLSATGAADLHRSAPRVRRAGPVAHLHTRITGRMADAEVLPMAKALHPTPAVGGTPRAEALALIRALEPRDRSLYAGYWGPLEPGRADLFVNIRCMELFPEAALLHVGAGITTGSDPQRECDEVERKARTWLDLIDAQRPLG